MTFRPSPSMLAHVSRELGVDERRAEEVIDVVFAYMLHPTTEAGHLDAGRWIEAMDDMGLVPVRAEWGYD